MSELDLDIHKYCFDDSQSTFEGDDLDKKSTIIFILKTTGTEVKGFCYDENDLQSYIRYNMDRTFFRIHVHIKITEALLLYNTFFLQKDENDDWLYIPIPIHRAQLIDGNIVVDSPSDFRPSLADYQLNVKFLMAVEEGNLKLVQYLVERGGVNVNVNNGKALKIAKAKGYRELKKYLKEVGAVKIEDAQEEDEDAELNVQDDEYALIQASMNGNINV